MTAKELARRWIAAVKSGDARSYMWYQSNILDHLYRDDGITTEMVNDAIFTVCKENNEKLPAIILS